MINLKDKRFSPCTPDMKVPYRSVIGWYYVKGHPNTRIEGSATIGPKALVSDNAHVYDNAQVLDIAQVYGNACVIENAVVQGVVHGYATVGSSAKVYESSRVSGNARITGYAQVFGSAIVYDNARVSGDAQVCGHSEVRGNSSVYGTAVVKGDACVDGCSYINAGILTGQSISISGIPHWNASLCAPKTVKIGCKIYPISEWLKHPDKSMIPWMDYLEAQEIPMIQNIVSTIRDMEKAYSPWEKQTRGANGRFLKKA